MARIGIDGRMYRPGATGIGRYIFEITKKIFEFDTENDYFLFLNEEAFLKFECNNPKVTKIKTDANYYSLSEQTIFLKDLINYNLDLVHFTHFNAPILYNKPFIVTIHDLTLSKFPGQKMNSFIHRAAYNLTIKTITKKADRIISVSENTKQDIESILGIDGNKIDVIYEGITEKFIKTKDAKVIKNVRDKFMIKGDYILYVGVWRNHKNLVGLIKAFDAFKSKVDKDIKLLVTGKEDNIHYPEVRKTIDNCLNKSDIITPGFVSEDDLVVLYSEANALVNPSFYEGFGFPPLEAMSCETPVVLSDASCHREICGDAALYFDPNNLIDIALNLEKVVYDKKVISILKKNAKERVKIFKWDDAAKKTYQIYLDILANHKNKIDLKKNIIGDINSNIDTLKNYSKDILNESKVLQEKAMYDFKNKELLTTSAKNYKNLYIKLNGLISTLKGVTFSAEVASNNTGLEVLNKTLSEIKSNLSDVKENGVKWKNINNAFNRIHSFADQVKAMILSSIKK